MKLAALVPPPRAQRTRFHGILTPGIVPSALRAGIRLFQVAPGDLVDIDVTPCIRCGGAVRIEPPGFPAGSNP